jgi:hypothetical protein
VAILSGQESPLGDLLCPTRLTSSVRGQPQELEKHLKSLWRLNSLLEVEEEVMEVQDMTSLDMVITEPIGLPTFSNFLHM